MVCRALKVSYAMTCIISRLSLLNRLHLMLIQRTMDLLNLYAVIHKMKACCSDKIMRYLDFTILSWNNALLKPHSIL